MRVVRVSFRTYHNEGNNNNNNNNNNNEYL